MKKLIVILLAAFMIAGCSSTPKKEPVVEQFSAEYEMVGTTSAGKPKNDTFIFEGETTDGIITKLNFDIIRNKGMEGEYSKKSLMGYMMNVADAEVKEADGAYAFSFGIYGYDDDFGQYMVYGTLPNLTDASVFGDMALANYDGTVLTEEQRIRICQHLADEGNITLTEEVSMVDLLNIFGLKVNEVGKNRVSFAGYHGGRSYGEQIDAIVAHILANNMTLEDVYEMFKTVNQQSQPIDTRDAVTGATIAFVGDFQRVTYMAMTGEVFEGVVSTTKTETGTVVEVATQGYGGEIETHVTFDTNGKIVAIKVRDAQETENVGALVYAEGSEFFANIIANQDDLSKVDVVSGATVTSTSLLKAVQYAIDSQK